MPVPSPSFLVVTATAVGACFQIEQALDAMPTAGPGVLGTTRARLQEDADKLVTQLREAQAGAAAGTWARKSLPPRRRLRNEKRAD
jgi:hypothetical protein